MPFVRLLMSDDCSGPVEGMVFRVSVKGEVERMSAGILNDAESDSLEDAKKGFRPRSMNRLR